MSVTLPNPVARAAERLIEQRVREIEADRLLAIALGDVRDEEFEAMRQLRKALREAASAGADGNGDGARNARVRKRNPRASATRDRDDARRVAVGRHAYEFLRALEWSGDVNALLDGFQVRKTLVGMELDEPTAALFAEALRRGAERTDDKLQRQRLTGAAKRLQAVAS